MDHHPFLLFDYHDRRLSLRRQSAGRPALSAGKMTSGHGFGKIVTDESDLYMKYE
jgi:hypothetical protein